MPITAIQGFACRSHLTFHCPLGRCVYKVQRSNYVSTAESPPLEPVKEAAKHLITSRAKDSGDCEAPEWKKLSSKDLGIRTSKITKPTRMVLNELRKKGYEVYLVGGYVRDLILKRTPKDFDIITSAELKVLRTFPRCEIVGKRFPICHVHVDETIVEVSSFSMSGKMFGRKSNYGFRKPAGCSEPDFIRWRNYLRRDFTINGLMLDPFAKIVYDYMGGMEDIRKAKVRSVIPADTSFVEDCARILRGVRIAARLGFRLSRETSHFVKELSFSLLRLDKGRILMELNYMLAYGSAEASLRQRILFPRVFEDVIRDITCFWVAILAFHKALVDKPRDPLVVAAFSIAIHSGGSLSSAVDVARRISQPHDTTFYELSQPPPNPGLNALALMEDKVIDLAASVEVALNKMTDEDFVSQALEKYPQAPRSDMVCSIFKCVRRKDGGGHRNVSSKRGREIDYEGLAMGRLSEVRHLFARIVFDTVYPTKLKTQILL